jgi:AraC-like DNA-binding protein
MGVFTHNTYRKLGIFMVIALCFLGKTQAQVSLEDSLKSLISMQKGKEKLATLDELMMLKYMTEDGVKYIDMLREEAQRQKNELYIGRALQMKANHYANTAESDSFYVWAERSKEYSLAHKQYGSYFTVESYVITRYIYEGSYELALFSVEKMLEKAKEVNNVYGEVNAYEAMGLAYISARRSEEAIKPLVEGFNLLRQHFPENKIYIMEYAFKIIQAYYDIKDYKTSLEYCDLVQKEMNEFWPKAQGTTIANGNYILMLNLFYGMNYIHTGEMGKARRALEKALELTGNEMADMNYQNVNIVYADYYLQTRQYAKALEKIDEPIEFFKKYSIVSVYLEALKSKAEILVGMRRFEEAYNLMDEVLHTTDSLATENLSKQITEIRVIHQVDKMEMDALAKEAQYRNRLIFIGIIVIIFVIGFVIVLYQYRKKQLAYRALVRQSQQWAQVEEVRTEENQEGQPVPDKADSALMEAVELLMKKEKLYKDSGITLSSVAEKLEVSRNYVSNAINHCTGKNFNTYINEYRVKEAIRILSEDLLKRRSIDDVAIEAGFNDRHTFSRTFKKITGLSPTSFRNSLNRE